MPTKCQVPEKILELSKSMPSHISYKHLVSVPSTNTNGNHLSGRSRVRRARALANAQRLILSEVQKSNSENVKRNLSRCERSSDHDVNVKKKKVVIVEPTKELKGDVGQYNENKFVSTKPKMKVKAKKTETKPVKSKPKQRNQNSRNYKRMDRGNKKSTNSHRRGKSSCQLVSCTMLCDNAIQTYLAKSLRYSPQPSQRIVRSKYSCSAPLEHDGDTWVEIQVVRNFRRKSKDSTSQHRMTRSLFYSLNRRIAYWDEPPSGASKVLLDRENLCEI